MIGNTIGFLIRNLPVVLLLLALLFGALGRPHGSAASRFLAWVLLFPSVLQGHGPALRTSHFPKWLQPILGGRPARFSLKLECQTSQ